MDHYMIMIVAALAVAGLWAISYIPNKKDDHKKHKP